MDLDKVRESLTGVEARDDHVEGSPPIEIVGEDSHQEEQREPEVHPAEGEPESITEEQVRNVVGLAYDAAALVTGHPHWRLRDEEMDLLAPRLAHSISRIPILSRVVREADAQSGWALLAVLTIDRVQTEMQLRRGGGGNNAGSGPGTTGTEGEPGRIESPDDILRQFGLVT